MLTKIYSAAISGIDAFPVTIETAMLPGTQFFIVGMGDTAVKESQQRMISAIIASGYRFPHFRTTVNLAPADVRKEGAQFDLPMAVGLLLTAGDVKCDNIGDYMITGELSLDGSVLPVKGVLPMAIKAREMGLRRMIVPEANVTEAAVVNNVEVYGVSSLLEALDILQGSGRIAPAHVDTRALFAAGCDSFDFDFSEVRGQDSVKRAMEVACAGGHNIIMVGPPGAGKSMIAKRIPTILPPLTMHEALETTKIHSVAGKLPRGATLMTVRPFRTPHHTVSPVALAGGGASPTPGEISLANNGVLFLDEFPEFSRNALEVLRQPIEDRAITVTRSGYSVEYPANFMLVASMNPCPCGYYGHPTRRCTCTAGAVARYMNRISGPLLDRIDLQVEIQPVAFDEMADTTPTESSASIRERVIVARAIQGERFRSDPGIHCNAQMNTRLLRRWAWPDAQGMARLKETMARLDMSARAFDRILRVARTVADLRAAESLLAAASSAASSSSSASSPSSPSSSLSSAASYSSAPSSASVASSSSSASASSAASRSANPLSRISRESLAAAAAQPVTASHIAEAISYRSLDRGSYGQAF